MSDYQDMILVERERKQVKIEKLKNTFKTVVTVKSNLPGEHKQNYLSYLLVDYFMNNISLNEDSHIEYNDGYDGPNYLIGTNENAKQIKDRMTIIENTHKLGRFIDIDVFSEIKSLSRGYLRKCYLCDQPAMVCIRQKNHQTQELIDYIEEQVINYFKSLTRDIIDESIMFELDLHPKFGLVTPFTNGSHDDMNYHLMIKSKEAILPYIIDMFIIGWSSESLDMIFHKIRKIGMRAEEYMLKVTDGVNAYKGLIFNLGIVTTAFSYCLFNHINLNHINTIISKMTKKIIDDFNIESNTFGYFAFKNYNILGARGEVQKGILNVIEALDFLNDFSIESRLKTLMFLITKSEDTVLLKRAGSLEFYYQIKDLFKNALFNKKQKIDELNQYCIDHNLSFGGSADLLIVTMFLKRIRTLFLHTS